MTCGYCGIRQAKRDQVRREALADAQEGSES